MRLKITERCDFNMTLKTVIDTLDQFRDEYNMSQDPEVKKLCAFVSNTIESLESYLRFFEGSISQMEQNKEFYTAALETLNSMIGTEGEEVTPEPEP